jgi:hypothetical protein
MRRASPNSARRLKPPPPSTFTIPPAIAEKKGLQTDRRLYGQEINPETYAVCKADMLLKGEGQNAEYIYGGAEYSTLWNDAFPAQEFDFMLSNPPYGKSWKTDHPFLPATPDWGRATSAAGSSKKTGSKPSSPCR